MKKFIELIGLIIMIGCNVFVLYLILQIASYGSHVRVYQEPNLLLLGIEIIILTLGIIMGIYISIKKMLEGIY